MGIETVSLIVAAFVNGSLGIASLMRNFRSRLCVSFSILAGILFAHDTLLVLSNFEAAGRLYSPRIQMLTTLLAGPATLWFLRFLVPRYQSQLRRIMGFYLAIIAIGVPLSFFGAYERYALWFFVLSDVLYLLPAAIWISTLTKASRATTLTRERLRMRYAFWGGFFALAIFVTNALHFAGFAVPPLGTMARTIYLIFVFQIFIQKELMTAEEVVAKVALFGGVALMLSIIFSLLVSWVGDQPGLFFFNTLIASFVILVLFDPIRSLTVRLTRSLFLHKNTMLEEELNRLSGELMGNVEPTQLAAKINLALSRALGVEGSALFLLERDGLSYFDVGNEVQSKPVELATSNALVEYMILRRGRPFVLETVENDRDSFHAPQPRKFCQDCLDTLRGLGADFAIPFMNDSRLVGFCLAATGERVALSNEQMRLFIPVARQIALLLKNAQTFTLLRDKDKLAAVGEMAAGMAHEIKNPLGAIQGAAELLKGLKENDSQAEEFLSIILHETKRLSLVLTDFLDYAKPRRESMKAKCDPLKVIEHTANLALRETKVTFDVTADPTPIELEADPELLKQVLLNLFLNAVQAMDIGTPSPRLTVSVKEIRPRRFPLADKLPLYKIWEGWEQSPLLAAKPYVEIKVADNGPGVSAEDLSRIFVPFFTTKAKGTGLGLAISQRILEGMGGTIHVGHNSPRGCLFTLHVPLRRERRESGRETARGRAGERALSGEGTA